MLDLCSGCGVVGLDFLHHCGTEGRPAPRVVEFVEVQAIYAEHFALNRRNFLNTKMYTLNYRELLAPEWSARYDLIVCNPPYFQVGQGALSPSDFKNRCRFFMDADFPTLIRAMAYALKSGGHAYCLMRKLDDHGIDTLQTALQALPPDCTLEELGEIRGTSLLHLTRRL